MTAQPPNLPRRLTCARCGAAFECTGDVQCWCLAEPYRLPMPDAIQAAGPTPDCLCPACLRQMAEEQAAAAQRAATPPA